MSESEKTVEGWLREADKQPTSIKVKNLRYEINELKWTQKNNKDPVIAKQIAQRISAKERALKQSEDDANEVLKMMVRQSLQDSFKELIARATMNND